MSKLNAKPWRFHDFHLISPVLSPVSKHPHTSPSFPSLECGEMKQQLPTSFTTANYGAGRQRPNFQLIFQSPCTNKSGEPKARSFPPVPHNMRNQRNKVYFPNVEVFISSLRFRISTLLLLIKRKSALCSPSSPCAVLHPSKSQNNLDQGNYPAPAQSGAKLRWLRACPPEFGVPPRMETPQPLWATCHQAWWSWTKPWSKALSDLEENT